MYGYQLGIKVDVVLQFWMHDLLRASKHHSKRHALSPKPLFDLAPEAFSVFSIIP
jgi:hypothetical protein